MSLSKTLLFILSSTISFSAICSGKINEKKQKPKHENLGFCTKDPRNVSAKQLKKWIENLPSKPSNYKYIAIDSAVLSSKNLNKINLSRMGAIKALFHTSFAKKIGGIKDVSEKNCLLYEIDIKKIWGESWDLMWKLATSFTEAPDRSDDKSEQPFVPPSSEDIQGFKQGVITTSRLAYVLMHPSNYYVFLDFHDQEYRFSKDQSVVGIGGYSNGIPCGPRVLLVKEVVVNGLKRLVFLSGDPSTNEMDQRRFPLLAPLKSNPASDPQKKHTFDNMPRLPERKNNNISGFEAIQQLPNGLLRFAVLRNSAYTVGTRAIRTGVIDPGNPKGGYQLVPGRSCMGCHTNGIRGAKVDTSKKGNGWSTQKELDVYFLRARGEYFSAMEKIAAVSIFGSKKTLNNYASGRTKEPVLFSIEGKESSVRDKYAFSTCLYRDSGETKDKFKEQIDSWKQYLAKAAVGIKQETDVRKEINLEGAPQNGGKITWKKDILPLLSSRVPGKKYDCISCHTEFEEYNVVKDPEINDLMMRSMRGDGITRMPRLGDTVPEHYIEMFEKWAKNPVYE